LFDDAEIEGAGAGLPGGAQHAMSRACADLAQDPAMNTTTKQIIVRIGR
jgi:hypothetical protein